MKITTLVVLSSIAITSAVAFLASTYGIIDGLTSSGVFTATLLAATAISDYGPRRHFKLSLKPSRNPRPKFAFYPPTLKPSLPVTA